MRPTSSRSRWPRCSLALPSTRLLVSSPSPCTAPRALKTPTSSQAHLIPMLRSPSTGGKRLREPRRSMRMPTRTGTRRTMSSSPPSTTPSTLTSLTSTISGKTRSLAPPPLPWRTSRRYTNTRTRDLSSTTTERHAACCSAIFASSRCCSRRSSTTEVWNRRRNPTRAFCGLPSSRPRSSMAQRAWLAFSAPTPCFS